MEDKISIVNWLLTRRCNLKCSYCGIVRDYKDKPGKYPDMKYYLKNEMTTHFIIKSLELFYKHNPFCFHLFYGGEPMLRKDLSEIICYCNDNRILYTIITNNTPEVQPMIADLFLKTGHIAGITSSIDPLPVVREGEDSDFKSSEGFKRLVEQKEFVKDVVAEITVTSQNVHKLYETVKVLSEYGINSSITCIDPKKSPYYDFSNVNDPDLLLYPDNAVLLDQFELIKRDPSADVHMKKYILNDLINSLPSNYDCALEKRLHNITIDSDGSLRLCLRIKGVSSGIFKATNLFMKNAEESIIILPEVKNFMTRDKYLYCRSCNWTCPMMSSIIGRIPDKINELIHDDRR